MKKKHHISIKDDLTCTFKDIASFKQDLLTLKGKEAYLTVAKVTKSRSGNQNRYAHGVVFPMIADCMGCEMEEAKDALKFEFLRKPLDCGKWTTRQTSSLTTMEFEDFLEKCRRMAVEMFNCYIPEPNECEY